MAGGPFHPRSAYPEDDGLFDAIHTGPGSGSKYDQGLGVEASISADKTWGLRIPVPEQEPTGTAKLRLLALSNVNSLVAKVNVKWGMGDDGIDPSSVTLNAEGTTTVTWGASSANKYIETLITLDATSITAGGIIVMSLVFETTGWTVNQRSVWFPMLVYQ